MAVMAIQLQFASFMSDPLGSPIYHLVLLLVVQTALFMAWSDWRRTRQAQALRMMLAMVGLSLVNLGYFATGLITLAGASEPAILLPPYERFAGTASIGFIAWAFAPSSGRRMRFWDLAVMTNLVLALCALVLSAVLWSEALAGSPALNLNTHWLSAVWKAWQIVLILLSIVGISRNREEGWIAAILTMVVILLGQVTQIVFVQSSGGLHLPTWTRLANLIAYPLLTIAVYQRTVTGHRYHSSQLQDINQASLDQIKSLLHLSEASLRMSSTLDLPTVLSCAAESVTSAFAADLGAVAILLEDNPGAMHLAALHNVESEDHGELDTFPLEYQPAIRQALQQKRHVFVEQGDDVQVRALYGILGSSETGPLLIQPLLCEGEPMGVIIVGRTRSRRPFTHHEAKLGEQIALHLQNPIQNSRRFKAAQDRIEQLRMSRSEEQRTLQKTLVRLQDLSEKVTSIEAESETLRETRDSLETQLSSSRSEVVSLTKRLAEAEVDLAQQQAEWEGTIQEMVPVTTVGVLVTDARGVIRATNTTAEILLERAGHELRGLELGALDVASEWLRAIRMASQGRPAHLEVQVGGNTLTCDVAHLPQPGTAQDAAAGLVVILQKISTEAKAQRARLEAIAAMAGELRTPLSTVIGYADLLLSEAMGGVTGVTRKFLQRIKADAERMSLVVNELAVEASGTDQEARLTLQSVQLNDEIDNALVAARAQLAIKVLSTDVQLASDLPTVEADPEQVQRILGGLLSNACMASPVGGRVQIKSYRSGGPRAPRSSAQFIPGFVTVSIKDQGGGLTDAALDQVFDGARPSQTPPGLGESGAGLAFVKELVEAHDGHIWIDSRGGSSTTFSFSLPTGKPGADRLPSHATRDRSRSTPEDFVAG